MSSPIFRGVLFSSFVNLLLLSKFFRWSFSHNIKTFLFFLWVNFELISSKGNFSKIFLSFFREKLIGEGICLKVNFVFIILFVEKMLSKSIDLLYFVFHGIHDFLQFVLSFGVSLSWFGVYFFIFFQKRHVLVTWNGHGLLH